VSRYLRASLGEAFGYVPGEQPPDGAGWTKLNTNESPLPPSPRVAPAVMAAAAELNRYPSPLAEPLRSAIAAHHGVAAEQVLVGNGGDGIIDAAFRAFCEPGATVLLTDPTYSLLPVVATLHAARSRAVPLDRDGALAPSFASSPAPLRFVVNPNTPTGTWLAPEHLAAQLGEAEGVVVIDEAYCDYAPASFIPHLAAHPSWLVMRTFSKSYALAGLRVGYAVGAADLIADLQAVGESYPVDRCAIAGAMAALADAAHHDMLVETVVGERARLTAALRARGWQLTDSRANYVCGRPADATADETAARLREKRVLVRRFGSGADGLLRITVGAPAENDVFLAAVG
jgi:histidinol-phosphate aminotransferase